MEQLYLNETFKRLWQGQDPFEAVQKLEGEVFRKVKSRRTLRFMVEGRSYFLKLHFGTGWVEIFKNWSQGKIPILGATNEYQALLHLATVGVETMTCVAYGKRGFNPAQQLSFIVTEDLIETENLEDVFRRWLNHPPAPRLRRAVIETVGRMCRTMHRSGLNHRDCYLCHFLLKQPPEPADLHLHIIDLHRAQLRQHIPRRWQIKDLAGLYFSALDLGLTRLDLWRFLRAYEECAPRDITTTQGAFWHQVSKQAKRLYDKEFGQWPQTVL